MHSRKIILFLFSHQLITSFALANQTSSYFDSSPKTLLYKFNVDNLRLNFHLFNFKYFSKIVTGCNSIVKQPLYFFILLKTSKNTFIPSSSESPRYSFANKDSSITIKGSSN